MIKRYIDIISKKTKLPKYKIYICATSVLLKFDGEILPVVGRVLRPTIDHGYP